MEYLIDTNHLNKRYGKHQAVLNVNMRIRQGDIYGLIGENGAGKTNILKMISGLARPDHGDISLFGRTGKAAYKMRSHIGALIESPGFYPNMTLEANLKCKCLAIENNKPNVDELMKLTGLADHKDQRVKKLSLGMKQRLGIALALAGYPDIVILDEPINGLDPQGIANMRELILRLNREKNITFLISRHFLEELSKIATYYGILHKGVLLKQASKEELYQQCKERIELNCRETKGQVIF